ncbi:hypothetical protein AA313_de0200657 [Arthrobotrys entomopaga]|nr:hypothetical protein AA313_de0200657 [Arthrobotrys entomopaga]
MLRRATASAVRASRHQQSTARPILLLQARTESTTSTTSTQSESPTTLPPTPVNLKPAIAYDKSFPDENLPEAPVPLAVRAAYHAPLKIPATYNVPSCDLQIRSFTLKNVEFFADFAVRAAYYLKLPAFGPIPLPRRTERWTVPKSVFVHKKSQQNFERVTFKRLVQIKDGHPDVVQVWLAFLRKHEYHGIGMKANVYAFEKMGAGSNISKRMAEIKMAAYEGKADHNQQLSAMRRAFNQSHNNLPDPRKEKKTESKGPSPPLSKEDIMAQTEKAFRKVFIDSHALAKAIKLCKTKQRQSKNTRSKSIRQKLHNLNITLDASWGVLNGITAEIKPAIQQIEALKALNQDGIPTRLSIEPLDPARPQSAQAQFDKALKQARANLDLVRQNTRLIVQYLDSTYGKTWKYTPGVPKDRHEKVLGFVKRLEAMEKAVNAAASDVARKPWTTEERKTLLRNEAARKKEARRVAWAEKSAIREAAKAEEARIAEAKAAEEAKVAEAKAAEEARIAEETRAAEIKAAEEARVVEEAKVAEAKASEIQTQEVASAPEEVVETSEPENSFRETEERHTLPDKEVAEAQEKPVKSGPLFGLGETSPPADIPETKAPPPEPTSSEDAVAADKANVDLSGPEPLDFRPAKEIQITKEEASAEAEAKVPVEERQIPSKENTPSPPAPQPTESEADVAADSELVPPPTPEATKDDFRNAKEVQIDEAMKKKDE